MMEGFESRSVLLTNGSGSGKPKNLRIRNTETDTSYLASNGCIPYIELYVVLCLNETLHFYLFLLVTERLVYLFLRVGSPYLRQLLTAGPEETMDAVSTVILLPDFPADDFSLFLKLLCTGIYRSNQGCESSSFRTTLGPVFTF
jgi:hypothetical protein